MRELENGMREREFPAEGTARATAKWPEDPGEAQARVQGARGPAPRPEKGRGRTGLGGWGAWDSDSEMTSRLRYAVT